MTRIEIRRVGLLTAALAVGSLISGCSDGTGPGADLTREQAEKIAQAASQNAYLQDFGTAGSAAVQPTPPPLNLSAGVSADTTLQYEASGDGPCRGGGTAAWSVEVDAFRSEARDSVTIDGTLQYDACTSTVDSSTVTLTSVDDSAFAYSGLWVRSTADSTIQWSSDLTGSVEWALDGESGTCSLDLDTDITVTGVGDPSAGSVDATTGGRVCDHTVERSFSLEAGP